jgi:IS605 OrfB family transposase
MSTAERKIHAWLRAGKEWNAAAYVPVYRELGLSAVMFRMARNSLEEKLRSISELAKLDVEAVATRIKSKKKQIATKRGAVTKARNSIAALEPKLVSTMSDIAVHKQRLVEAKTEAARQRTLAALKKRLVKRHYHEDEISTLRTKIRRLRRDLHQHGRKVRVLELRLERAQARVGDPSICFGSKKLFRKQFQLAENGYANHEQWLEDWRDARRSGFALVGAASVQSGNEVAKLSLRNDGQFDLELRLPPALRSHADRRYAVSGKEIASVTFSGLDFNHGHEAVVDALARRQPISVAFRRDERSWTISVAIDEAQPEAAFDDSRGCLGVDFNADHVAATLADRFGNLVERWTIPLVTHGLSSDATLDAVRKAAAAIAALAVEHDVPVVSEKLDFSRKKAQLRSDDGAAYARMLSSFAYASFDAALASACCRSGVWLRRVEPAFTSLIGRTCFATRYGLTTHAAAALAIARRAMGLSERMPKPVGGELKLPLDGGGHVTLPRPARIGGRHVWSSWKKLNDGWKSAHAARGRTGRKSRSPAAPTASPPGRSTASRRGNYPPSSVGLGSGVPS